MFSIMNEGNTDMETNWGNTNAYIHIQRKDLIYV